MVQDKKLNTFSTILMAVFGVILLIWASSALKVIAVIIGIFILAEAAAVLVNYFKSKETPRLIEGIVLAIVGLIFVFNPKFIVSIYPFLLGAVIVVGSILNLVQLFSITPKIGKTWALIAANIVVLILGIVIMINPFETASTLVRISGVVMIIDAILGLLRSVGLGTNQ